jgi:hypothetical protein
MINIHGYYWFVTRLHGKRQRMYFAWISIFVDKQIGWRLLLTWRSNMTIPVAVSTNFLFTYVELIQRLFKLSSLIIKFYVSKFICPSLRSLNVRKVGIYGFLFHLYVCCSLALWFKSSVFECDHRKTISFVNIHKVI